MKRYQLATFAGAVLLSVACGQKNNAKPADKPADKPAPTPTEKPADKPAPTASAPATPTCRALVNGTANGQDAVFDIKIGATSTVEVGEGASVMVDNGQTFAVQMTQFEANKKFKVGSMSRKWSEIVVTPLPGGTAKTVTKNEPEVLTPEEDGGNSEYYTEMSYSISSLIGPYLSLSVSENGYTGGAHEFDSPRFVTLKMPEGTPAPQDVLKAEAGAQITAQVKKDSDARRASGDVGDDDNLPEPGDFNSWSYSFQSEADNDRGGPERKPSGSFGLRARSWLDCCSWAENHNLYLLEVTLPAVPSTLKPFLTLSADNKWIEAPDGCGAVSLEGGSLKVRVGKDGAPQDLGKQSAVYGVYWVDAKNTFTVSQLPKITPKTVIEESK